MPLTLLRSAKSALTTWIVSLREDDLRAVHVQIMHAHPRPPRKTTGAATIRLKEGGSD
jgi:hypothetical protein